MTRLFTNRTRDTMFHHNNKLGTDIKNKIIVRNYNTTSQCKRERLLLLKR